MYITNIDTSPAGAFSGPMVVSMRPVKREQVVRAVQVTSRFRATHGAPVHIGSPGDIGIRDLERPDFGEMVDIKPDEEPVFWACGVTPQAVALNCKPPLMITHAPGRIVHHQPEGRRLLRTVAAAAARPGPAGLVHGYVPVQSVAGDSVQTVKTYKTPGSSSIQKSLLRC